MINSLSMIYPKLNILQLSALRKTRPNAQRKKDTQRLARSSHFKKRSAPIQNN